MCGACGYDVRELGPGAVCPECGSGVVAPPAPLTRGKGMLVGLGVGASAAVVVTLAGGMMSEMSVGGLLFGFLFIAPGCVAPLALLGLAGGWRSVPEAVGACTLAAGAVAAGMLFMLYDAFVANPDPQGAIVVVFLSPWAAPLGGVGALVGLAVAAVAEDDERLMQKE